MGDEVVLHVKTTLPIDSLSTVVHSQVGAGYWFNLDEHNFSVKKLSDTEYQFSFIINQYDQKGDYQIDSVFYGGIYINFSPVKFHIYGASDDQMAPQITASTNISKATINEKVTVTAKIEDASQIKSVNLTYQNYNFHIYQVNMEKISEDTYQYTFDITEKFEDTGNNIFTNDSIYIEAKDICNNTEWSYIPFEVYGMTTDQITPVISSVTLNKTHFMLEILSLPI